MTAHMGGAELVWLMHSQSIIPRPPQPSGRGHWPTVTICGSETSISLMSDVTVLCGRHLTDIQRQPMLDFPASPRLRGYTTSERGLFDVPALVVADQR